MTHTLTSLDPRINRLGVPANEGTFAAAPYDQFQTFEVFQQVKDGKPLEHVGIVHAPDLDLAFLFGKEQYSRRGNTCTAMALALTQNVFVSAYTDGDTNALAAFTEVAGDNGDQALEDYDIYFLKKRGKQHVHLARVKASSHAHAAHVAAVNHMPPACFNVWVIKSADMLFTDSEDRDIWNTLVEKKYRDAIAYKAADKIARFKAEQG